MIKLTLILMILILQCAPQKDAEKEQNDLLTLLLLGGSKGSTSTGSGTSSSTSNAWATQTSGVTTQLNRVHYLNSKFWAVGNSGTLLSSSDGKTWTKITLVTTKNLNEIIYASSGKYVIVGEDRTVITSTNGTTWTETTAAGGAGTEDFYGVAYDGSSVYGIVGVSGIANYVCGTTDLSAYSCLSGTKMMLTSIVHTGSRFSAVGISGALSYCTASCATAGNWIEASLGSTSYNSSHYIAGTYIFGRGFGYVTYSFDYSTFTHNSIPDYSSIMDVIFDGSNYVAIGSSGGVYSVQNINGAWTSKSSGLTSTLRGLATNGTIYVAVGDGGGIFTHDKY